MVGDDGTGGGGISVLLGSQARYCRQRRRGRKGCVGRKITNPGSWGVVAVKKQQLWGLLGSKSVTGDENV